jgi:hypothetical protein
MMETIIDIYQMSGQASRAYKESPDYTDIRAWILPASNETVAMYEGVPQGQMFQFRIIGNDIEGIAQQSKLKIIESQISGFKNGDEFITIGDVKTSSISGNTYITGTCYKKK